MTYLYVGIGLGLLCYAARWSRRRVDWLPASARDTGRRPRRRHRLGDNRRRRAALAQARRLVLALAYGRQNPFAHLVAGVVLEEGDVVFQQSTARLETWSTTSARVIDDHVSWGRRAKSPGRQLTVDYWQDHDESTWLLTSARAVGRSVKGGELVSIWWASVAGADVDARNEFVVLNATNGWRGRLSGPGIAPIAVAVVALATARRHSWRTRASPAYVSPRPALGAPLHRQGLSWARSLPPPERDGQKCK